jgi:hypothetical protein
LPENENRRFYLQRKKILSTEDKVINSGVHPADRALLPKNLTLQFSHQYLQTQSVEQEFFNNNSFFIKRGVKPINLITSIIAEISRILNVK